LSSTRGIASENLTGKGLAKSYLKILYGQLAYPQNL